MFRVARILSTSLAQNVARNKSHSVLAQRLAVQISKRYFSETQTEQANTEAPKVTPAPNPVKVNKANSQRKEFQAETRQLLSIVTNSLYTDREVFVRELVSNASDALEKLRYLENNNTDIIQKERPLQVTISVDEENNTFIIEDSGIGMNAEELVDNIGTIARSGSKQFVQKVKSESTASGQAENNIIGQFGVGFYAAFMVADKVEVYSQSYRGGPGHYWVSDGTGSYEMCEAEGLNRGTKIVLHLKDNAKEFAIRHNIERIVKKYSNFVGFPIELNQQLVNTIRAIWLDDKSSVTKQQYEEFYRYVANAFDTPRYTSHFHTDAPLSIHGLFFVPDTHSEKYGMGRMEPGVNLYSRKVMIQSKSAAILPDWLRFIRGVVDSEDIPLNISRETMQDSALIKKIRNVLTKRILRSFEEEGKKNPEAYNKFFDEFGTFLKEGICTDVTYKDNIAHLLRFESSKMDKGQVCSLDDYIARMPAEQKNIYYLVMPNRDLAQNSPYYEQFKANNVEVLFMYTQIDDLIMRNLEQYNRRKLVSVESSDAEQDLPKKKEEEKSETKSDDANVPSKLDEAQSEELVKWLQRTLSAKVSNVKISTRLVSSPALIVDHESAAMRRVMQFVNDQQPGGGILRKQKMEINPQHPIMRRLSVAIQNHPDTAALVAEQIFDNALIAAGLMDDPRIMLARLNKILESSLQSGSSSPSSQQ